MKVYGPLEVANLEFLQADPTNAIGGPRIYYNAVINAPKIYNPNTQVWNTFAMTTTVGAIYSVSATLYSTTINWANGLTQLVTLAYPTSFLFTNPVAGQVHTLIIQAPEYFVLTGDAANANYPKNFTFSMPDQETRGQPYQPQGTLASTRSQMYSWLYSAGIRPAYTTIPAAIGQPSTLPASAGLGIDISPDGKKLALASSTSPYCYYYGLVDNGPGITYLKQNATTPTTGIGAVNTVRYSRDGTYIAYTSGTSTYFTLYLNNFWDDNVSAVITGATPAGTAAYCAEFHPSSRHIAVCSQATPFVSIYPLTSAGVGTILISPVTLPAGIAYGCAWSFDGLFIAVANATTPYLQVWNFDYVYGWGNIVATPPSPLPTGAATNSKGHVVAWHPSGNWIAMATSTSPYLYLVPFNRALSTFGTPQTIQVADIPAGNLNAVVFSPDGNWLALGCASSPYLYVFAFTSAGYTTGSISFNVSGPGIAVNDLVFSPSSEYLHVSLNTTPYLITYPMPRPVRNYLKLNT